MADGGTKPGDRLFLDFSPGWRPYLGGIEDTDVVLFLEFNYVHAFADRADRKQIAQSGGSFFLMAPEILLSPNNRVMIKAGLQVPLIQSVNNAELEMGTRFVLTSELRF